MKNSTIIAAAALSTLAGAAHADLAATFGYTDMGANWNQGASQLTVGASATNTLNTSGDITNYLGAGFPTTALFNSGFADGSTSADSQFTMDLSNITATTADASGTFMITDINGDTLSGSYVGTWTNQFGFGFFDGQILAASYNETESGNSVFEGNAGQTFAVPTDALTGGLSMLLQMPEWFDSNNGNFNARTTQLDGILVSNVPTPGSLALLGLGGLVTGRRRR
jgi:MYXO-CTERM domain-containing protein